jgi:hypothetical protein
MSLCALTSAKFGHIGQGLLARASCGLPALESRAKPTPQSRFNLQHITRASKYSRIEIPDESCSNELIN